MKFICMVTFLISVVTAHYGSSDESNSDHSSSETSVHPVVAEEHNPGLLGDIFNIAHGALDLGGHAIFDTLDGANNAIHAATKVVGYVAPGVQHIVNHVADFAQNVGEGVTQGVANTADAAAADVTGVNQYAN